MVRSTLKPGSYEGQKALTRDGRVIGEITGLHVLGQHVAGLHVRTTRGRDVEIPRDWFLETTREGLLLAAGPDDVLRLEASR